MPNVASITIAMIETRTIPVLIAALHVLVERLECISPALPSRSTTSEMVDAVEKVPKNGAANFALKDKTSGDRHLIGPQLDYGRSPVSSPPNDESPQVIFSLARQRLLKFGPHGAKRLFSTASVESRCGAVALGSNISVSASFVWRCLSGSTVTPFPHPAHRTGQANLSHPALGQDFTPSPTACRVQAQLSVRARSARRGARVDKSRPCVA